MISVEHFSRNGPLQFQANNIPVEMSVSPHYLYKQILVMEMSVSPHYLYKQILVMEMSVSPHYP